MSQDYDLTPPAAPGPRGTHPPRSSGTIAWWATVLLLIGAGTMLVAFVFARVYLVGTGERAPRLTLPLVATGALVLAAVVAGRAHRIVRLGPERQRAAAGLAVATGLGMAHGAVLTIAVLDMNLDIAASAEDATFVVLIGYYFMFPLVALGASAVAAVNLVGSGPLARPRISAQVATALWQASLLAWLLVFVLLYLVPRLS